MAMTTTDGHLRVLVVDDSKVMRGIIRKMLAARGVDVLEAVDGKDAVRVLGSETVTCIVSDWNMPRMKGIDLLRWVRGEDSLAGLPFIMVTAEALSGNKAEADAARVTSYLVKPFTADDLWRVIEDSLARERRVV